MSELFDLDWDCEPDWDEDDGVLCIPADLKGQHLTAHQYLTMTDIEPTGNYL